MIELPRKKKTVEEETPVTAEELAVAEEHVDMSWTELPAPPVVEATVEVTTPKSETKVEVTKPKPTNTVKVKVLVGTLHFEDGTFEKGETFTVSKERVKLFDPKDIQILK